MIIQVSSKKIDKSLMSSRTMVTEHDGSEHCSDRHRAVIHGSMDVVAPEIPVVADLLDATLAGKGDAAVNTPVGLHHRHE